MVKPLLPNKTTWLGYLARSKDEQAKPDQLQFTGFEDFMGINGFGHAFLRNSIPFVYVLDYSRGTYLCMSENFGGYPSACFIKDGIDQLLKIYQPGHFRVFDQEIFPDRLEVLKKVPPHEHKNLLFSCNLSIKNKNGNYEHFLQRNCFLSSEQGEPLFSMGILLNMDHHMPDNRIIQTVEQIDASGQLGNQTISKKIYYLNEEDKIFSKREKEVLLWMADGLNSKMIAGKMNISENTVINHRRNMQDKSHTPNSTALICFALKSGII